MDPLSTDALVAAQGVDVVDQDGDRIGAIEDIYYDDATGEPEWVGIGTGIFGLKRRVVPVEGARLEDGQLRVPYDKDMVKDSPDVDSDEIAPTTERDLYAYYGVTSSAGAGGLDADLDRMDDGRTVGREGELVRNEEELRVGTQQVESGRVRLRKWVETTPVEQDVELRRETAEIHREPIDRPATGGAIGEDEIDVTLHAERPVVQKDVVARERISVDTGVETERETITEDVRRERVEIEGDVDDDLRRR
jgi:uncharacterized protein (TIGR02271 family)